MRYASHISIPSNLRPFVTILLRSCDTSVSIALHPCLFLSRRANTPFMFSLQRLLGKEDKFFDLLEASAKEAQKSSAALTAFLQNPRQTKTLDDFIVSRRAEKRIAD